MSADAWEAFPLPVGFRAECPLAAWRDPSGEHPPSRLGICRREPWLDLCSAGRRRTRLASRAADEGKVLGGHGASLQGDATAQCTRAVVL